MRGAIALAFAGALDTCLPLLAPRILFGKTSSGGDRAGPQRLANELLQ